MKTRFIRGEGSCPALELVEVAPASPQDTTPILLIHGAFGGAWGWTETFLPCFARDGRAAAAISMRGHGRSEGREFLREATLADYAADVRRALGEFSQAPIVIAHSLGALIVQQLLGCVRIRALVMLAPLPPEGMLVVGSRLLATRPELWAGSVNALLGSAAFPADCIRRVVFSDRFSPESVRYYLSLMVPEGARVFFEAHVPRPVLPAILLGIPSLVIRGGRDRLLLPETSLRTALYHGAQHVVVDGMGHLLQLEPGAESVARLALAWIGKKGL
jgi:pimeloyl-ACP methyl ester carboxylesterase